MHSSGPYSVWQSIGLAVPFPIASLVALVARWIDRLKLRRTDDALPAPEDGAEDEEEEALQEIENRTW